MYVHIHENRPYIYIGLCRDVGVSWKYNGNHEQKETILKGKEERGGGGVCVAGKHYGRLSAGRRPTRGGYGESTVRAGFE